MEKNIKNKVSVTGIYILAGIVCLALSIPILSQSITLDEAYTIVLVRRSFLQIIQGAASDVHPPLYYFLLKICRIVFGESIVKYRVVTALATYLNLFWLGATLIRRRWGGRVSCFYILWFGLAYCTMEKTMIIRMYPMGNLLVTAAVIYLFFLYENWRRRDYILSIVLTIAAMYTHYFAVMAVFAAWVILLVTVCVQKRDKIKQVIGGGIIIAIGYLPWMGALLNQTQKVSESYWISSFDWAEWFRAPALLTETSMSGFGNVCYVLILVLAVTAFVRRKKDAIVCILVFAGTMLIGAFLSVFVAPIWQERYLYVAWGVLALALAIVLGEERSEYSVLVQGFVVVFLCIMGALSISTIYQSGLNQDSSGEWAAFLRENVQDGDLVIADDQEYYRLVYQSYLPDNQIVLAEKLVDMDSEKIQSLFSQAGEDHIWFVIDYSMQREGLNAMTDWFAQRGFTLHSEGRYSIQAQDLEIFSVQGE